MIFNKLKLEDITDKIGDGIHGTPEYDDNGEFYFVNGNNLVDGDIVFKNDTKRINEEQYLKHKRDLNENTLLVSINGTLGNVAKYNNEKIILGKSACYINVKDEYNVDYVYFVFESPEFKKYLQYGANGTTIKNVPLSAIRNYEISIPSKENQDKIVKILKSIEDKIKLNNKINNNLEEQLRLFFEKKILKQLTDENTYKCSLYDQFDVIDNRGKTPPLVEYSKYPIIDVKVLSGKERVINYSNCLKYVDEDTYNTFFRSGHPKIYDTLLSTVGSLAELKIYLENIGTIAQNVVALRSKNDFPLFMYQYILSLRQKLTSYDIGSVQPSIKVTQFMKEMIRIPNDKELIYKFEQLAKSNTLKMKNFMMENRYLEQLRDTLLPKLMNGEIDLDNIEI